MIDCSSSKRRLRLACVLVAAILLSFLPLRQVVADNPPQLLSRVADFALPGVDGRTVQLTDDPDVRLHVICFLGTECPLARLYGPRLAEMDAQLRSRGVTFIGINSNPQDSLDELRQYAQTHGIRFAIAKDYDQQVARQLGATRTPEVFVVDAGYRLRYRGRIDDQYLPGIARSEATSHDLRDAVDQLLAGATVTMPVTEAVGCLIATPHRPLADNDVTFCNQVSRVLRRHCTQCHREGEIGPFALTEYDEVVGWADMMLEVIDQGRMPPWHASPEHGDFVNARPMPDADKQLLRDWVLAGTPFGDPRRLPPAMPAAPGWRLPETPELVFPMRSRPYDVPAEGTVEYQYFVVDPGFQEDRWVRAAEVIPGNPAVVHHCIVFIRPPDGSDFRDIGMLAAYVPGQSPLALPSGYARRIPAGSKLVFQMHYTPNGRAQQDTTRVGLLMTDRQQVSREVFALGGINHEFEIPPYAASHEVSGRVSWYPRQGELLSITPHMHLRGKSFRMVARRDGDSETLLEVPHYDFNWQHNYQLREPLPLANIDALEFTSVFDNSAGNPHNPDPAERVMWGDQTWEEMAIVFVEVAQPLDQQQPADATASTAADGLAPPVSAAQRAADAARVRAAAQVQEFVADFFRRFDQDADGLVAADETPHAIRLFAFQSFDQNGDGYLDRQEVIEQARMRF